MSEHKDTPEYAQGYSDGFKRLPKAVLGCPAYAEELGFTEEEDGAFTLVLK